MQGRRGKKPLAQARSSSQWDSAFPEIPAKPALDFWAGIALLRPVEQSIPCFPERGFRGGAERTRPRELGVSGCI
ncbi:unnamed protein product [Caretta caretta]